MHKPSTAENYHEATKYSVESLAQNTGELDWSKQPVPFKELVTEQRIKLAAYLPFRPTPFGEEEEAEPVPFDPDSLQGRLSRLLYFCNGITAVVRGPETNHTLRAAPSAGALYPTEIYLVAQARDELADGIYNYQVPTQSLARLWEGQFGPELQRASFQHPALIDTPLVLLLTGVYNRCTWRYGERGYRRLLLDTGHVLGNITSYAKEEGFEVTPICDFDDSALNGLMFLDDEEEAVLMMIALRPLADAPEADAEAEPTAARDRRRLKTDPASPTDTGETLVELHKNSYYRQDNSEPVRSEPAPVPAAMPNTPPILLEKPKVVWRGVAETILRRRSTRSFTGDAISQEQLSLLMWHSYAPVREENGQALCDRSRLKTWVVAHHVDDLMPGLYGYEPLSHELRPERLGDFTQEVWHLCLGQELGRDASMVIIHTADLQAAVAHYGDRAYRYLHLDAGHLGQYLNLAAIGVGLGASGIGGFFDDEVTALLGLPHHHIAVYLTCIGQPS